MSMKNIIDRPKELLELIESCLKPKDIEKKKFGEVFTPINFINDNMLRDLEVYYHSKYNKNIYEQKDLKWADTTAGMGNFPVAIYYKLMEGLKKDFPDEKERNAYEFAGVLLRYETEIIYEIKFDVITDKIKEEIHKVLEDVEKEKFAICVWTSCYSTFDDCEYMTWQPVTKEQLLREMLTKII